MVRTFMVPLRGIQEQTSTLSHNVDSSDINRLRFCTCVHHTCNYPRRDRKCSLKKRLCTICSGYKRAFIKRAKTFMKRRGSNTTQTPPGAMSGTSELANDIPQLP